MSLVPEMKRSFSLSVFIRVRPSLQGFFLPRGPSAFRSGSFYAQVITGSRAKGIAAHAIACARARSFVE
jgi:hypothetical protein